MNTIKEARQQKGMTIAQLASEVGVSCAAICRYENGQRSPKLPIAHKIGQVLDVPWFTIIDTKEAS